MQTPRAATKGLTFGHVVPGQLFAAYPALGGLVVHVEDFDKLGVALCAAALFAVLHVEVAERQSDLALLLPGVEPAGKRGE